MAGTIVIAQPCGSGVSTSAGHNLRGFILADFVKNSVVHNGMCSRPLRGITFGGQNAGCSSPDFFSGKDTACRWSRSSSLLSRLCTLASDSVLLYPRGGVDTTSKVIVIDNYDSFTYNLCQYLGDLGCGYDVVRNDEITIDDLIERRPRALLISPGPGKPQDSGISLESILRLGSHVPILGVCMGLQCMGEAFGGKIVRAPNGVVHGKTSLVYYDEHGEAGLLEGLPNPFKACRYHSLVIEKDTFPEDELEITAWTEDGLVMGVRHKQYRHIQGVQFHPESIITEDGKKIVANFVKRLEHKEAIDRSLGHVSV